MNRATRRAFRRRSGQSMVEMALLLPVFLMLIFGIIDFGRYVYTRGLLNNEVIRAARLLTLSANEYTDCPALNDVVENANGIINNPDPHSLSGDLDPSAGGPSSAEPSTPPAGQGYVYIYPSESTATPQMSHCTNTTLRTSGPVVVETTYEFVPWTPIISSMFPKLEIFATSTQTTEY